MNRKPSGTNRLNPGGKGPVAGDESCGIGTISAPAHALSIYGRNFRRNIVSADARVLGDRA
jgi:hypothetical protein